VFNKPILCIVSRPVLSHVFYQFMKQLDMRVFNYDALWSKIPQ